MKRQQPAESILTGAIPILVTLLVAAAVLADSAFAADPAEGLPIHRILFDASPEADVERARQTVRSREGDPYRAAVVQDDLAALSALGRYSRVAARTEIAPQGVVLIYELRPLAAVRAVRFDGDTALPEKDLLEKTRVKPGDVADPYRLKLDLESLRAYYREKGYLFASVEQALADAEEDLETDVVYTIAAGPLLRIESVRFEGNEAISAKELRKLMYSVRPARPYWNRPSRYDPVLLRSDLGAIREAFRRKGYLDATVGHELTFDEAKERAYVIIRIRQGDRYEVESLAFEGATLFDDEALLATAETRAGGVFSPEVLDADILAIERLYGRQGYIKAVISPETTFLRDEPRVRLTLRIEEGPMCFVNRVLIRGNWRTKDHVIRRDVFLLPGEQVDVDNVEKTTRHLTNTGLFKSPSPERGEPAVRVHFLDTAKEDEVDIDIEVSEGPLGVAVLGASYGSGVGLVGDLKLSLVNFDALDYPKDWQDLRHGQAFTGGGQALTLSLSPGTVYRDYRVSWFNPRVWDSPYHVGFDAYLHDYVWSGFFDTHRKGVALRVGRRFLEDFSVTLVPRVENVKISDVDAGAPPDAFAARGSHDRRSLEMVLSYDRRDNIFLPTKGHKLSASIESAGTFLGGDVDIFRETFEAQKWWTVWEHPGWGRQVFSLGARAAAVDATQKKDVPIFERFFLGGMGSVRGFRSQRAGPVDPATGKHVGGEYLGLMSAEYSVPVNRDFIRAVAFLDAGALEQSLSDFDSRSIRMAAGGGFHIRIPQLGMQKVPITLYLAFPIRKQSSDKLETFSFNFGTGFAF